MMASISRDKNGLTRILFSANNGTRKSIRLGKIPKKQANAILIRVEAILTAQMSGQSVEPAVAEWLGTISDRLHQKLEKAGLAKSRKRASSLPLAAFIDEYLERRTDLKPRTIINLKQAKRWLITYFGATKGLEVVTEGDADEFRLFLKDKGLAENTLRRLCGRARQLFRAAVKKRLITANPFAEMKGITVQSNPSKNSFITREEAAAVLEQLPDFQWRLIFALARFSGLRTPSETLALTWHDVDWENNRIRIRSPKTEHHEGKESRTIPIFPEVRPFLEEVWDAAEDGATFVITRYRDTNVNLRTELKRAIERANLKVWPKLFQNLRSTRETELAEDWPMHIVCEWMGNSQLIAKKHYLQVTDEHYEKAAKIRRSKQPQKIVSRRKRKKPHTWKVRRCIVLRRIAI